MLIPFVPKVATHATFICITAGIFQIMYVVRLWFVIRSLVIFIHLQCMLLVFWLPAEGMLYPLATVWVGISTIVAGCSLQSNVHNLKTKRKKFMRIFVTLHFHLPVQRYRDWQVVWAAGLCFCTVGFYSRSSSGVLHGNLLLMLLLLMEVV
jgi:hypothetical protein